MWEINNITQSTAFLWSVLLGCALSVVYDIFRLDRMIFKRSVFTVALEDILFWVISAFSVFCLMLLTTNGQIRVFVLIGVFIGFIIFRLTFSRFIDLLALPLKKVIRAIKKMYLKTIKKLAKGDRIFIVFKDFLKKCFKKPKNKQNSNKKTQKNS